MSTNTTLLTGRSSLAPVRLVSDDREEEASMSWGVGSWMETTSYVAENPARAAILISLAQSGRAMDEGALSQMAGMLHRSA